MKVRLRSRKARERKTEKTKATKSFFFGGGGGGNYFFSSILQGITNDTSCCEESNISKFSIKLTRLDYQPLFGKVT